MRWYGRHCGLVGGVPGKEASELRRCAVSSHRLRITRVSIVNSTFPRQLPCMHRRPDTAIVALCGGGGGTVLRSSSA